MACEDNNKAGEFSDYELNSHDTVDTVADYVELEDDYYDSVLNIYVGPNADKLNGIDTTNYDSVTYEMEMAKEEEMRLNKNRKK